MFQGCLFYDCPDTFGVFTVTLLIDGLLCVCAAGSRLDMVSQMNEVEARQEDYSETLSMIQLLNKLLEVGILQTPS